MPQRFFLGVDVGAARARAGIFDDAGNVHGSGSFPVTVHRPLEEFVELSSDDVWRAVGEAVGGALAEARVDAGAVEGIGFAAIPAIVALDANDFPVTVSPTGNDALNTIVGADRRALPQAARLNALGYANASDGPLAATSALAKLAWLKETLPPSWTRAARVLELADYLTYQATGFDVRSLGTVATEWGYLAHETREASTDAPGSAESVGRWDAAYLRAAGFDDVVADGYRRIGAAVWPLGERVGALTEESAADLGLRAGTPVGMALIGTHAAGLGLFAMAEGRNARCAALVGGDTPSLLALSGEAHTVAGARGPFWGVPLPDLWMIEAALPHAENAGVVIERWLQGHALGAAIARDAEKASMSVASLLEERLERMRKEDNLSSSSLLTRGVHVAGDAVVGLDASSSLDAFARLYLATVQSFAHATRAFLETMRGRGFTVDTLLTSSSRAPRMLWGREHADVTGCTVHVAADPPALRGTAMLGAVAAGAFESIAEAMASMGRAGRKIAPAEGAVRAFHDAKHRVFRRMHEDRRAYDELMKSG